METVMRPSDESRVRRVLLVDDDLDDVALTIDALRRVPWFHADVTVRSRYEDALSALQRDRFDVVLLDQRLGARTGLELLHDAFGDTVTVPVVLLTGVVDHAIDDAATKAGVAYLLEKAELSPERLERSVRYAVERVRAEQELRGTRAFFRAAFDALADHAAILDETGKILAVNDAWQQFAAENRLGLANAAMGVNYVAVCEAATGAFSDGAHEVAAAIRAVVLGDREGYEQEYPCSAPGEERWFQLRVSRFDTGDGRRVLVTHANITARRESEARYRTLFEGNPHPMWVRDVENGRVLAVNDAALAHYGYSREEFLARSVEELRAPGAPGAALYDIADRVGKVTLTRHRTKNGTVLDVEVSVRRLNIDGRDAVSVLATDVTERLRAERRRTEALQTLQALVDASPVGIVMINADRRVTLWNAACAQLFGWSADEVLGRDLPMIPEDRRDEAAAIFARQQRFESVHEQELQRLRKDGSLVDVLFSATAMRGADGTFAGGIGMFMDLTARKRGEREMAAALDAADTERRRLNTVLEALPVGVWIAEPSGRLTHVNRAAGDIWGGVPPMAQSVEDYAQYSMRSADGATVRPLEETTLARALRTGESTGTQLVTIARFDGEQGHVLSSAAPIRDGSGRLIGAVLVQLDVSNRHAAERERERLVASLQFERNRLVSLFERAPSFMVLMRGPDHVVELANAAALEVLGPRPLIGLPLLAARPEFISQGRTELLDRVRATGEPLIVRELPISVQRGADGAMEERFVNMVCQPFHEADGSHAGVVAHGVDVTEQVRAAQQLKRSEERYRDLVELSPDGLFIQREGRIVFANPAAARLLAAQSPEELIGKRTIELVHPDYREFALSRVPMVEAGGDAPLAEQTWLRLDGTTTRVEVTSRHMKLQGRPAMQTVFRDVAARHQLEQQLRQAQKMDAIGQLAGGVAHDFNNLLTVISAHSEFLLQALPSADPRREDVQSIHRAGVRAAGLTRQLLAFSRKQLLRPTILNLNDLIAETTKMLGRLLGEEVEIVVQLAPGLGRIVGDPGQLEQVLVNLAVNARDAMPDGGVLTIATRNVEAAGSEARRNGGHLGPADLPDGDYVVLEVRDTGGGMDAATQARLFEPFFTTKDVGRGTGLGLATVYGIVKQSSGYIFVQSHVGIGTAFSIYLPQVTAQNETAEREAAASTAARGTETVLLVEDEVGVRRIAKRILERHGFVVLEASDGSEALAIAQAFEAPIHLVLSDAAMPGLTGAETVRRLREQRPNLKAVFMSGYTDDEVLRRGIISSAVPFIEKPFDAQELAQIVRQTLDR
jgi:PAS domain S-box-containing protein